MFLAATGSPPNPSASSPPKGGTPSKSPAPAYAPTVRFSQASCSDTLQFDPAQAADYDEQLQEDLYLGKLGKSPLSAVPNVKNTFIHFDVNGFDSSRCIPEAPDWATSPPAMLEKSFHTKYPNMEQAHVKGECKPCAYHVYKPDGCRHADACPFCHLCTRGEIKRRKKQKAKALKAAAAQAESEGATATPPFRPAAATA
mmetsp:Transcript_76901/g.217599  ORF Transcript_76901/g.217599 Transcript_76901/m.217599 type:complete len:199 (-) Transcript_76901:137-733(-)